MSLKVYLSIILVLLFGGLNAQSEKGSENAKVNKVSTIEEYNLAIQNAKAGSIIILKNGIWKDFRMEAYGQGTALHPIIIKAETNGKVILTGDSKLNIFGDYIMISGLWFKDGTPSTKEVITFRKNSKIFANNCRLTECVVSNYNPIDRNFENHWVDIWGKNNRIDHNNFTGKTNGGTTLVVWLKGQGDIENRHRIDHNFFGKRPSLGVNGGETIRIGTSENSMKPSKTLVEFNTFKHCNGEIEIISNKSCDNIFRNNLFIESEGCLTLRHGDSALVENNVFIGNNKPKTGGIRVINEGHIIRNNFLLGLTGDDFRGAIVLMNGVPNSPINRYRQVKNVDIQNNTIINCGPIVIGAGNDQERSLAPISTLFANNLVSNTTGKSIIDIQDKSSKVTFRSNIAETDALTDSLLFKKARINWNIISGFPIPADENKILETGIKNANSPDFDMNLAKQKANLIGAFNLGSKRLPAIVRTKTGPSWKAEITDPEKRIKSLVLKVKPGNGNIYNALKKAYSGSTLALEAGTYYERKTMDIEGDITIRGEGNAEDIVIKSPKGMSKGLTSFFRVNEGARFTLENTSLDGENSTFVKYAIVSPREKNDGLYSVFVDDVIFRNFKNNDGGSIFKAYVGTLADTISISNSILEDSYRGLNLSYQKDETGKYNAELIILYNTLFKDIDEFALNYLRSGYNETSRGGHLQINHCVFSKVARKEPKKIIGVKGIKWVNIRNSVFENSIEVKIPVSLSGSKNSIENCLFYDCGFPKFSKGALEKDILYKNPKWEDYKKFIPKANSPLLKEKNRVEDIGLIRK